MGYGFWVIVLVELSIFILACIYVYRQQVSWQLVVYCVSTFGMLESINLDFFVCL